jgi:hypothetical protein
MSKASSFPSTGEKIDGSEHSPSSRARDRPQARSDFNLNVEPPACLANRSSNRAAFDGINMTRQAAG